MTKLLPCSLYKSTTEEQTKIEALLKSKSMAFCRQSLKCLGLKGSQKSMTIFSDMPFLNIHGQKMNAHCTPDTILVTLYTLSKLSLTVRL